MTTTGLAYVAAYTALDYLSFIQSFHGLDITPWNPPPGLTLCLFYLGGVFYAPFALTAPVFAEIVVRGSHLPVSLEIALSVIVAGTYMLAGIALRRARFDPRLTSVGDVFRLIVAAAVAAFMIALLYTGLLSAAGYIRTDEIAVAGWRYFVGDLIGVLVVTPLGLAAATRSRWPAIDGRVALQAIAIICTLCIVFGYRNATTFQLFYLLFMPFLWISMSHGIGGAIVANLAIQIGLIIGAGLRFGSFPGLTALQALMIALAITGLFVGAVVTERQLATNRLRQQEGALQRSLRLRASGEVAAAIAHEINQPLTALAGYTSVLEDAIESGDMALARDTAAKISRQSERAAAVVSAIRGLLRQSSSVREGIDVAALVNDACGLMSEDMQAKGIVLRCELPGDLPKILGDRMQLRQALHNLLTNSMEAIHDHGDGGEILFAAKPDATGGVMIEVADTGPGFGPDEGEKDVLPFVTSKTQGTGLGLSIVRSIVEAHAGRMELSSSPRGATVTLWLPKSESTA